MKTRSLKQKLIFHNTVVLSSVFLMVMVIFIWLSYRNYHEQLQKTQTILEANLKAKGRLLVIDKTSSLKVHVGDSSFGTVKEIVATSVREDKDIVYGGYIRSEDFQPWVWVTPENPGGDVDAEQEMRTPTTEWALRLDEVDQREYQDGGNTFLWVAAPLYLDSDDGESFQPMKVGAIIYGFSKDSIVQEFAREEELYKRNLRNNLFILGILAFIALTLGMAATRRQATTISEPVVTLTSAADAIAAGNYQTRVRVQSGDEIETLASSFNAMARDLAASYDDLHKKNQELEEAHRELADLNRHLEEKVEERTKQLAESESKFRTLFEESADAILLGNEHELFDCNPAMLEMMGFATKKEFLTLVPEDISPEMQPDGSLSGGKLHEIFHLAHNEGSRHFEWVNRRKDGSEFPSEIVITSFPLNGNPVLHMVFRDITERKKTEHALMLAQQKLVESAHSAGMNEIATGVLHNIGNILNSVNISTEEIELTIKHSKLKGFLKANKMIRSNLDRLDNFLTQNPKGKLIPHYFLTLGEALQDEYRVMGEEVRALTGKISMMRDVISTQQNYAKSGLYTENVAIADMVDDAIKLHLAALQKQGVRIRKKYHDSPTGSVPKVKLIHVLTNLIKNGQEAMIDNERWQKPQELEIEVSLDTENMAIIRVADTGCGIKEENLEKIFSHGFTTKANGHGFGLHTCANFMTEMGGILVADSEGEGKGAVFTLRFPLFYKETKAVHV